MHIQQHVILKHSRPQSFFADQLYVITYKAFHLILHRIAQKTADAVPADSLHIYIGKINSLLRLILQKLLHFRRKHEVGFQKGSQWFSITNDFCQYLLKEKAFVLKRFKYTLCPDEIFIQTVLWNSPFRKNIYRPEDEAAGNMRLIDWHRGGPYVWKKRDYDELVQSDKLFARKFSSDQMELVNHLEATFAC